MGQGVPRARKQDARVLRYQFFETVILCVVRNIGRLSRRKLFSPELDAGVSLICCSIEN